MVGDCVTGTTTAFLEPCIGATSQEWARQFDGEYVLKSNGKCLTAPSANYGTQLDAGGLREHREPALVGAVAARSPTGPRGRGRGCAPPLRRSGHVHPHREVHRLERLVNGRDQLALHPGQVR